ncbi:phosphoribosylglycinamide formyltransferase [Mahella australiensis]|uniref:Phosphoribosylglycinamide formyltransferase n=1 Tax=Mahella australiensis (strain DSM 15567 / CIP 107919 / 50-1 BON) TaxID=697281 RepID=F3ZZI7_MAHA5|nr:phosphoribosylglycinamide formyltransferase [Mahella australiensis]AEE96813.1 formyltetrahydrofolate-dependent phosphoribosylglycinamide formyltransferase [Mahella australiensis 50-1 BON]
MKKRIGVLVSGGGTNLQAIMDKIDEGYIDAEIAVVISNRKDAYALERAKAAGIDARYVVRKDYESDEQRDYAMMRILEDHAVDLVVLAGYLGILSKPFIDAYRLRIINVHPSLIPAFCGKGFYGHHVHQAVLDYGVKVSGATVHFVDEGIDAGPIILQKAVEVKDDDTADTLAARVLEVEHELLPKAVKLFLEGRLSVSGRHVHLYL